MRELSWIAQTALKTGYEEPDLADRINEAAGVIESFLDRFYDYMSESTAQNIQTAIDIGGTELVIDTNFRIVTEYADLWCDHSSTECWDVYTKCKIFEEFQKLSKKFQEKLRTAPIPEFTMRELRHIHTILRPFLRDDLTPFHYF